MTTGICDKPKWKDAQEFRTAVYEWCDRIQVKVKQIHLRPMKQKWASISTTGRLTLNTELLELPKELGEFVIVHELVHLLVPNHSKLFKCFISMYLPNWEELEKQLQKKAIKYGN
jgi:predicted metal-dependent hydrolase